MGSDIGKEMLESFRRSALEEIAKAARNYAEALRSYPDMPFASDDARRFGDLESAIDALWPRVEV